MATVPVSKQQSNYSLLIGIALIAVLFLAVLAWFFASNNQSSQSPQNQPAAITNNQAPSSPDQIRYQDYSPAAFASAANKKRVLFFYAAWCPTCRPADAAFRANPDEIPDDVVLFRVNYDTEDELKQEYGITYQHTFVWVDENGEEITKWNGGQIPELVTNTRS